MRTRLRPRTGASRSLIVAAVLALTTTLAVHNAGVAEATPAAPMAGNEAQMATEIANMINNERAARGLSRLPINASVQSSAQAWANQMPTACPNSWCHSAGGQSVGEIVAYGSGNPSSAAVRWWMNSTVHRTTIVANSVSIGVGVKCASNGTYQAVVHFGNPRYAGEQPVNPIVTPAGSGSRCAVAAPPTTQAPPPPPPTTKPPAPPTTRPPVTQPPAPPTTRPAPAPPTTRPPVTQSPAPSTTAKPPSGTSPTTVSPKPPGSEEHDRPTTTDEERPSPSPTDIGDGTPTSVEDLAVLDSPEAVEGLLARLGGLSCLGVSRFAVTVPDSLPESCPVSTSRP